MSEQDPRIEPINVADEMSKSFLDYSMSVIISRALPDVRDGLKPSQRRILFAMRELSLFPNRKPYKCAKICGDTSGNYHPHGEAVIYPTLVNMAQPWSLRDTLIEGQGNFGSIDGDPPAAMRYTEARLTHMGTALMEDMDKDTVDFVPNYDERLTEPTVFPAAFPNLLVNGGTGIAVGMATNLPPHNLGEIVDGIIAQVDNPQITVPELCQFIKGPDFPTAGIIHGTAGIAQYLTTGRGQVKVRGKVEIEEGQNGREQIVITEIPYNVNRATLMEKIAELANEKIIPEISGMRDECDENTRIVIELRKDARAQVVVNNLFKHTALESTFSVNMLAIDNRRPRLLTIKDAIACYIDHRREVVLRRTKYLLGKAEERAEILEAQLLASGNIDDFIRIIRGSKDRAEAEAKIKEYDFTAEAAQSLGVIIRDQPQVIGGKYIFSDRQVKSIVEMQLYKLTSLERQKVKNEYDEVLAEILDLIDIIRSETRVLNIIKSELNLLRQKYATPRKTVIKEVEGEIQAVDLIPNDAQIITISHRGYIRRTPTVAYRTQSRGGKGLKGMETRTAQTDDEEDDFVEHVFSATAHDFLMFFTNTGRVFAERVYQIPEGDRTSKGRSIKNLLNLRAEEKIASVLRLPCVGQSDKDQTFDPNKFVIFATKNGTIKRTNLGEFRNMRKDGIIAINILEGNTLIGCELTNGKDEVVLVTRNGMSLRLRESGGAIVAEVAAEGEGEGEEEADVVEVEVSEEETDDAAAGGEEQEEGSGAEVKEKGGIRDMGRKATGVRGIRLAAGDYVVSLAKVEEGAMLLVASENGIGKRTDFEEYRVQGRGGKGIRTMKTTDKTGKVARALVVHAADELMLMTNSGQSVRIPVESIREAGRNTQGVKLITLREGEFVQDVARVDAAPPEAVLEIAEAAPTDPGAASEATDDASTQTDTSAEDTETTPNEPTDT